MWVTMALGLLQMYFPLGMFERPEPRRVRPPNFARNMLIVGGLRLATLNISCILNCVKKRMEIGARGQLIRCKAFKLHYYTHVCTNLRCSAIEK